DTFLFGGFGDFDAICHKTVTQLKNKHPYIKRVYCLTDQRFLNKNKRPKYLKDEDYEDFIYLPLDFDFWYTRIYYRNCEMIKKSNYVIFYVEERKNSGAFKALKFAIRNKTEYINLK
ncbi:MAG: hypothetical protein IJW47_02060, partial [Clostridia bacterium]|nr:hypothetical protein [Clostridia bacterium]